MPYTHSLIAAVLWSVAAVVLSKWLLGIKSISAALWIGAAVFSHWILDLLVHRPDLPIYDDTMKVGLGLWNCPAIAISLEAALLFVGMILYLKTTKPINLVGRFGPPIFGVAMLAIQAYVFFGPPPVSPAAAAVTALGLYVAFACVGQWLDRRRTLRS
jgi:hypothetical protein